MSNQGVVDEYLTKEEQEYFNSGGTKPIEEVEDREVESDDGLEREAADDSGTDGQEDADSTDSTENLPDDDKDYQEEPVDEPNDPPTGKKRDLEKAFKAEHHKRKEAKAQLEAKEREAKELQARLADLEAKFAKNNEQSTKQPEAPPEVVPDPEDDPIGYQQYKIGKLEKALNNHQQYLQSQYEQQQRSQSEAAFMNHYKAQAESFAKDTPDFMDAYNFLMSSRIQEHVAAGFSEEQAKQLVVEDEIAVASLALQQKANAAERLYNIAKTRGYSAKSKESKGTTKSIESLKRGLNNSKSLKSGGGELPERESGMDEIDGMSFEEFDSHFNKIKERQKHMR